MKEQLIPRDQHLFEFMLVTGPWNFIFMFMQLGNFSWIVANHEMNHIGVRDDTDGLR